MPEDYKIAAAYICVSTDDQVELSPASQLVEIRKWAAKNGWISPRLPMARRQRNLR